MNDEVSKTCLIRFRKKRLKSKDEHLKVLVVFCLYLFFFFIVIQNESKNSFLLSTIMHTSGQSIWFSLFSGLASLIHN